jgi:hypothetical protein
MASRDHARSTCAATPSALPPLVNCDLCGGAFILPAEIAAQGVIYGLLVCTQCIEDNLNASADEPRCEVGMVAGGL